MKNCALLEVSEVSKAFYEHTVLDHVSFRLEAGEVLGLVGQNGAGKSTLMKILTGVYEKDSGSIKIDGKEAALGSIQEANTSGISIVFQELSLALNMTVADNIFVGNLPLGAAHLVDKKELYRRTQELIDRFHVDIRPDDKVGELTIGKRQIVEIIKAISKNPRVLILDEPTSSLEESEIQVLFNFIRSLKEQNYSIIYISHHMSEIFEIVDNILILRDGKKIRECGKDEITVQQLISLMIGREYESYTGDTSARSHRGDTEFEVRALSDGKHFSDISFSVARGEVLGIAGIIGCGKTELCEAIYGARAATSGSLLIEGKALSVKLPSDSKDAGVLCIPENRKTQGLFLNTTVHNNMIACVLNKMCSGVFLNNAKIRTMIEKYRAMLNIKMTDDRQIIRFLSGGNQQKVLVAKTIADDPKVLIAMDPTRGIDVASKEDIHRIIHELSRAGLSVLVITSELDELMNMCDRILVMNSGRLVAEYERENFNEAEILLKMHQLAE